MSRELNMLDVINESFTNYAGAVLQSRALVDVRDCIKPSARQIFYCLYTDKFLPNKPFKKTLKAIGSAMRLYIHGDSSAEGVILRASQDFALRYPLVEVEGNNGNLMESGNWAAPRYTAARISPLCVSMFNDIGKNTISDWCDNYDDTEKYPSVLPTKGFYNIVNGTLGLGIGAMSSIPQFNLKEVNSAMEKLLLNPNISFDEIYCCPDFATGGYLLNEEEVKEALKNGTGGSCRLRAKINYNEKDNCLIVTEIPYGIYTNTICGELEEIVEDSENPGIDRFNDLTGTTPLIKIYLKKGVDKERIIKYLFKKTSLQHHYTINMTMLKNGRFPCVFGWKDALQEHINHEKEVYIRGYKFDLEKIEKRIHIIDGLLICLASINEVIATIKGSSSTADAKNNLMKKFLLSEEQATAVLKMQLSSLAKLEVKKLENEKKDLEEEKRQIEEILNNEDKLNEQIIKGWQEVSKKYGDKRRTESIHITEDVSEEILPEPEDIIITVSTNNKIKRTPLNKIKRQSRNTKGVKANSEIPLSTIKTSTVDILYLFTDKGKMYSLASYDVEDTDTFSLISQYIPIESDEKVVAVTSKKRENVDKYVVFFTKNGYIKKSNMEEYKAIKKRNGIAAIKLEENDNIIAVAFANDKDEVMAFTKDGMSIRFNLDEVNAIGRITRGVAAIKLNKDDYLIAGIILDNEMPYLLVTAENGLTKKLSISDFPSQKRAGKGISISKEKIVNVLQIKGTEDIVINAGIHSICIPVTTIPETSRIAAGVKTIKSGKVTSTAIVR